MRNNASIARRMSWLGEQAQTQFLDLNLESHETRSPSGSPFPSVQKLSSYSSLDFDQKHTIRFQVIVWSVGIPDVKTHTVTIMFRVTVFWNDPPPPQQQVLHVFYPPLGLNVNNNNNNNTNTNSTEHSSGNGAAASASSSDPNNNNGNGGNSDKDDSFWVMDGRRKAIRRTRSVSFGNAAGVAPQQTEEEGETIDVPPISIINAETFETVGQPDVARLRVKSRLMRFSCMYRARLMQESMNVAQFPHDSHDLVLKLGILSQRQPGGRWDRRKWKLGLANESDTQGTVRVPFGVLVDHVAVPGFRISDRGLEFELSPIEHGNPAGGGTAAAANNNSNNNNNNNNNFNNSNTYNTRLGYNNFRNDQEFCVKTKIRVKRNSSYYDRNIMPLLDILNLVSISILVSLDANNFFQRGLLCLNIAFVEVGLRTSLDARLPTVGYEIKMQKLLNSFFFSILYIVLESAAMKVLIENHHWPVERTRIIDRVVAFLLLVNQLYLRAVIYKDFSAGDGEFGDCM